MDLTLNELKAIRNGLNAQLRTVCIETEVFMDVKRSLTKVKNEMERIEIANKQKACDVLSEKIKEFLNKPFREIKIECEKEDTLDDLINSIEAIDGANYSYGGSEVYIKIEVDYVMLEEGELERLFLFRDRNKNCVISFK